MALWEGAFQHVDPLTYTTMMRIQLEDSEELASTAKGMQRESTLSDAQFALQMYREDLRACEAALADRNVAQSLALAILRDEGTIQEEKVRERRAVSDWELGVSLQMNDDIVPQPPIGGPSNDNGKGEVWQDLELLSNFAAICTVATTSSSPQQLISASYLEGGAIAESSTRAAARNTNAKSMLAHCVACRDNMHSVDLARVPCKNSHEYCRDCLSALFRLSMTDETLFPPRCCGEVIPLRRVRFWLPSALAEAFEVQYVELSTKNRTYCHDRDCATFIPTDAITSEVATCPRCRKTTCTMCKQASHSGDCPEDTALQQLLRTANAEQWQRCFQCTRFVELETGCNHMTCPCGAQFCYVCGLRWHTCGCPRWEERRLTAARAERIIDRNPRRALFQPQRMAHPQPPPPSAVVRTLTPNPSAWEFGWAAHSDGRITDALTMTPTSHRPPQVQLQLPLSLRLGPSVLRPLEIDASPELYNT